MKKFIPKLNKSYNNENDLKIFQFIEEDLIENFYNIGVGLKNESSNIKKEFFSRYSKKINLFGVEPIQEIYNVVKEIFEGQLLLNAIDPFFKKKKITINLSNPENSGFLNEKVFEKKNRYISQFVNCISLDKFDYINKKKDKILLWMDIEGHELNALLSGAKLMSSGRVKLINLEARNYTENYKCSFNQIHFFLTSIGYEIQTIYNVHLKKNKVVSHFDTIYKIKNQDSYSLMKRIKLRIKIYFIYIICLLLK
jgi:FkbM family methyltransferase